MLSFQPLTLEDRQWIQPLLQQQYLDMEEYSFSFCYMWRNVHKIRAARVGDYVVFCEEFFNRRGYYFAGSGDIKPLIQTLWEDADARDEKLDLHIVTAQQREEIERAFPGAWHLESLRDYADYIYDRNALSTLAGKKLHGKRNHINQFIRNYPDWVYEPIAQENMDECRQLNERWYHSDDHDKEASIRSEYEAIGEAFDHYFDLGLSGGLLRVCGEVVAFAIGDPLNEDTFMVHFEKALSEYAGAYAMINREFASNGAEGFAYINRQDDMGEDGLRKAKLSYNPVRIADKYSAVWQKECAPLASDTSHPCFAQRCCCALASNI